MLVHRLKQFIKSLLEIKTTLKKKDLKFLALLVAKYQNLFSDNSNYLGEADHIWLENLFALRWKKVARKFHDYTFGSDGVNAHWISFAKDLAVELHKPYLLILMPTITNRLDPNDFSRLNEAPDPRCIYISGNTGHRVDALYTQLQKKGGVFGIFDNPKNLRQRPLTIHELDSLRQKRGADLAFINDKTGVSYANIWDYLKRKVAPTCQIHGLSTSYLLPDTLKLVEDYFDGSRDNNFNVFNASCKNFFDNLVKNPLTEVNHFYGARIKVNDKRYYLFEILVDCLQENKQALKDKLLGVAKWIAKTDPSLISKNKHLKPIYARLKIGEYFDLKAIRRSVIALNIADTESFKLLQMQVLESLDKVLSNPEINEKRARVPIIGLITKLFHMRGREVIDTKYDYTRYLQKKANFPWLQLALKLAGAGDIKYFHALLIPSLKQENYSAITLGPFSELELNKCILSSSGEELIYLPHCKSYYKANGLFYKNVHLEPEPLSSEEIERLAFADPAIYKLFCHINAQSQAVTISKITINEIRKLVNGSLNPAGLEEEIEDESEDENTPTPAQLAYNNFALYLSSLPMEEKNNLLRYKVTYRKQRITLRQLFGRVQAYDPDWRGCATLYAKSLAQVVMDHAPHTKFINAIEQIPDIPVIRATSAKKVYSDYNHLTDTEAVKRILTLITSIMTRSFNVWFRTKLTLGNYENKVDSSGKEIFELVSRNIERGDFRHARFFYVQLIEHLVPNFVKDTLTADWLSSIQNETMFLPEKETCFDPEYILIVLWPIAQRNTKIKSACEDFLSNVHKILTSSDNKYKKWVLVNIGLTKLLMDPLLSEHRLAIVTNLRLATGKIAKSEQNSQLGENFISGKETYFDPELILTVLWPIAQKNPGIKLACDNFLDNLHEIQASSDRRHKKWIRVNVEFSKLLSAPSLWSYNSTILVELKLMKDMPPNPKQVLQASKEFLIHRLAQLGSQNVSIGQVGIFGCAPGQNTANYVELKKLLNEKLEFSLSYPNCACLSFNDLLVNLDQILMKIDKKESSKLKDYLRRFDQQRLVIIATSRDHSPLSKLAIS